MKKNLKSIMVFAFSISCLQPSSVNAKDSEDETIKVGETVYQASLPIRWFSRPTIFGEKLDFGSANDRNEAGFWQLDLDIKGNLSYNDKEKWGEEICDSYIYPECLAILNDNKRNGTISLVLGLLYFSGIPNSDRSKNSNFLERDIEKSKQFIDFSANLGMPAALNFRALITIAEWYKANPNADILKLPPSVEQDLKAAAGKGYDAAKLNLAALYMDRKKYTEARVIYEELSARRIADGNGRPVADASYALGVIYLAGYGVPSDYVKARNYFAEAAPELYYSVIRKEAYYNLGMMYFSGQGGVVDYKLALQWLGQAAKEKFEPAIAALPAIDKARQSAIRAVAANDVPVLSKKETNQDVNISALAGLDPKYNPECPEEYVILEKVNDKFNNKKLNFDIFVIRMPMDAFRNIYFNEDKINAKSTFNNKITSEKPVVSCLSEVSDKLNDLRYERNPIVTCYNNYTGKTYNALEGAGIEMDDRGLSGDIVSCTRSTCFILQDKSGEHFVYRWKSGQAYDWWDPDNFERPMQKEHLLIENGAWKGGLTSYRAFKWRNFQGYVDIIILRKTQFGYICTMKPQNYGNF